MIFGTLGKNIDGVNTKLYDLKNNLSSLYSAKGLYSKYGISLGGLSQNDIQALQEYVNTLGKLKDGESTLSAFNRTMGQTSQLAQQQAIQFTNLRQAYDNGEISFKQYSAATRDLMAVQKSATVSTKALNVALNLLSNVAIMAAITGLTKLIDLAIMSESELDELRNDLAENIGSLADQTEKLVESKDNINSLIEQYKELNLSTTDISSGKEQLIEIQQSLVDEFGKEAESLDLLNGKYDENIEKIKELSQLKYDEWLRTNASDIKQAEAARSLNVEHALNNRGEVYGVWNKGAEGQSLNDMEDKLYESYYVIKNVSKEFSKLTKEVDGADYSIKGLWKDDIALSGTFEEAYEQLGQLIDLYRDYDNVDKKTLDKLTARYELMGEMIAKVEDVETNRRQYESSKVDSIGDIATKNISSLKAINSALDGTREKWFETIEDIEKGFGKNVDKMTSSLQSLANGDGLSSSDFWELMKLDTENILTDIKMMGDKFIVSQEQLIRLKDQYIQQQITSLETENKTLQLKQQELSTTLQQAQAEMSVLGARGLANSAYREEYNAALNSIKQGKANLKEYGDQIKRNNIYIEQLRSKLGNTVDLAESLAAKQKKLNDELSAVNKQADDLVKAQEYRIDRIIDEHKAELEVLNDEKQILQDELDNLNDQKDALEDIIGNYEKVNSLVQNTVQKEIDSLEEQKKEIEDTYNKRIEALKAENKEREDALDYAQKLKNLENAKNNKTRVYDEARGWHYASNSDNIKQAQNELGEFENRRAIEQLEAERDSLIEATEDIIDTKTKYAEQWKEVSDLIQDEADEELAKEILGADWREKIMKGDTKLLSDFTTQYMAHNTKLRTLTNTEINLKNKAIEAKDAEIKAKNEQIESWQKYRTEVENAAKSIKESAESYMAIVRELDQEEPLTLENRGNAFENFKNRLTGYMDEIGQKQYLIDQMVSSAEQLSGGAYDFSLNVDGLGELREAVDLVRQLGLEYDAAAIGKYLFENGKNMNEGDARNLLSAYADASSNNLRRYSEGGVADYTGLAMLHGKKGAAETIFNANDSAKLYELVHNTPNLMAKMVNDTRSLASSKGSAPMVSIGTINVTANNPQELTRNLDTALDKYFTKKLTASYTQR